MKLIKFALAFILTASAIFPQKKNDDKTSLLYLSDNLKVLASEEFEGRETTTRGEKVASLFLASELEKYGVKPFGDKGTYFQNFDLNVSGYSSDAKILLVDASNNPAGTFLLGEDFIKSGRGGLADASFASQSTGLVFAGNGIINKEKNIDDYANIDVKGKTILLFSSDVMRRRDANPPQTNAPVLSNDAKVKIAMEKGAAGVLFMVDERMKPLWNRVKEFGSQPSIAFITKEQEPAQKNIPVFMAGENFLEKIFSGEKISYKQIIEKQKANEACSSFEIGKKVKYDIKPFSNTVQSRNVIGLIEGSDPVLKNEYVVISAHYDHIGTRNGVVGNGADDDGSGTVAVLESSRLLSSQKKNKRSIIFLFNTGEEKGLLGSKYATENGAFMKGVAADINMDMVGRESADSIYCIGSDKLSSEFAKLIKDVNSKTVRLGLNYKYDDPNDPERFYYRSDHYNFGRKGIPVVFFFDDMKADYHKPTDDVEKINFEKILKVVKLSCGVAVKVANMNHKPVVDKKVEEEQPRQRRQ